MRFSFSTDALPPEARFEQFRDTLMRGLFQFDMVSETDGPYRGKVDLCVGGPAVFGQVYGSQAAFHRSPHIARQCEEGVWLLLTRSGRMVVKQDEVERVLEPGDGVILDAVRPHSGRCALESDTWVVKISGPLLQTLQSKDAQTRTTVLERNLGVTQLIVSLLQAHERVIDQVPEDVSFLTAQHLADLVAAAMGADRNGRHLIEGRSVKAARRQSILDDIAQHYLDADLSAEAVAARLGLTPRYVHRLLEDTGQSFSEHVLELRLRVAQRLLVGPLRAGEKISDIAYRCGFSDLSYFNRTFRRRVGRTPTELRANARNGGGGVR